MSTIADLEHRVKLAQEAAEAAHARGDFVAASRHEWRARKAVEALTKQRIEQGEA